MKLKNQILLTLLSLVVFSAWIAWINWCRMAEIAHQFDQTIRHQSEEVLRLENIKNLTFRLNMEVISYATLADDLDAWEELEKENEEEGEEEEEGKNEEEDFFEEEVKEFRGALTEAIKEINAYQGLNEEEHIELISKLRNSITVYQQLGESVLQKIAREEAVEKMALLKALEENEEGFLATIESLIEKSNEAVEVKLIAARELTHNTRLRLIGMLVLALIITLGLSLFIARRMDRAFHQLRATARRLGEGDYSARCEVDGADEFKAVGEAFNQMAEDLQHAQIIEQKNEELARLNQELKAKNDALDSFVYRVSHDLKAPVINIEGFLKLMKKKITDDTPIVQQSMLYMSHSLEKLKRTIFDLLEVSRIEKGLEDDVMKVALADIATEVTEDLHSQIDETGAQINYNFTSLSHIHFSPTNLRSLFSNLITNAVKYRSEDRIPQIEIASSRTEDQVILSFEDNGIGIDMERYRNKLFQMFNRFHNHVEGSGVGLYIVHKIVTENNGSIEIESTVDVGTRILIKLPLTVVESPSGQGVVLQTL